MAHHLRDMLAECLFLNTWRKCASIGHGNMAISYYWLMKADDKEAKIV